MTTAEESVAPPGTTKMWNLPPRGPVALAIHGGAGGRIEELGAELREAFETGLAAAYGAGKTLLGQGGSALDAVCACVAQLEDDPLFNAGRGAALTIDGVAEHDAAVMDGNGAVGSVAASRHARNPVLAARSILEEGPHVFLVAPSAELVAGWGLATADQAYFVTEARLAQLGRVRALRLTGPRHGTVGAVARDARGHVAAATSTGGMVGQRDGRVGDTPLIGAGTYARDDSAAVSCTGEGEAFIRGLVSHDIAARVRYLGCDLAQAVTLTIEEELTARGASGGLVAVSPDGRVVVAHNSPTMFAAFEQDGRLVMLT